ncbi:MAG: hypothetical protein NC432_11830 [Roseburia sp.]|nr:hypothetical protein [Roseburia sp.]MCM1099496.1 hypothetical protein [Ruminococcus flavefaciens]
MSLILFKKSSSNKPIEVSLSAYSNSRIKVVFADKSNVPKEKILTGGFVELNEHNYIEQSNFSDMNYIYQKLDELTYVLTSDKNDVYIEPETDIDSGYVPKEYIPTIEELRNKKISALSSVCNRMIISGVAIDIDGNMEHFSYSEEDQVNIKELFDLAIQTKVPLYYHADGSGCKVYTVEQIVTLYTTSAMNKMHHITYFNQLKMYINTLNDADTINAMEYGFELTGEYLDTYNAAMTAARISMETLLKE